MGNQDLKLDVRIAEQPIAAGLAADYPCDLSRLPEPAEPKVRVRG